MGLVDKKIAVITGGAQGIGRAIALKLAKEGASVAVIDINFDKAKETVDEIKKLNVDGEPYRVDVSNTEEVKDVVDKIIDKFKRIDILVNNAGITKDNLLIKMSEDEWNKVIDINLKGVFNLSKAVARYMMKQRNGNIVNISSVVGLFGNPGQINYSASKAGVIGITKTLAKELASRNIRVNAVAPGFIQTAMTEKLGEDAKKRLTEFIPVKKLGEPEDVANAVLFLSSELSSYITGEVIRVDGGMAM